MGFFFDVDVLIKLRSQLDWGRIVFLTNQENQCKTLILARQCAMDWAFKNEKVEQINTYAPNPEDP